MEHYYSEKQKSPLQLKKIKIKIRNREFELYSSSGVFSKDALDKGTGILIENAHIEKNWHILDLGCGIGVVGISIKIIYPDTKVLMTDINERAVYISGKNIDLLDLHDIEARKSNIFDNIKESFNTILVNPPQTAGKDVCFRIIQDSYLHLEKGGTLQLVARHNKGGITLEKKMLEVFGNVSQSVKKSGYRVYVSIKSP
jgi:16S rRNA (guanine1207-N2)-methyltransferase